MLNLKIYQINGNRDENRMAFMHYDSLEKFQGSKDVNSSIYDKVWEGSIDGDGSSLEDIYTVFNLEHPRDFRGHSLSVSDIVEIVDAPEIEKGFYFCDSFGFKKVEFEPEKTQNAFEQTSNKMKVVALYPGERAKIEEIDSSLEGMQKFVGGDIEASYPFDEEVCIVCNEEGKIMGLPLNRAIYAEVSENSREMIDIIAGPAFICDCSGENFASLSEEQLKHYEEMFKLPERFYRINGQIVAETFNPEGKESLASRINTAESKAQSDSNGNNVNKDEIER